MFPLLPFAAGLLAGAAVVKLVKTDKSKATLEKVQSSLRTATASGLAVVANSSANLRSKLMTPSATPGQPLESTLAPVSEQPEVAPPVQKSRRRRPAAKTAGKPAPENTDRQADEGAS